MISVLKLSTDDPGLGVTWQGEIDQSPSDTKRYRALTLANGLRVLLISDPGAPTSADKWRLTPTR
jgi:hypothetical protein